ncbi:hypothetical protein ACFZB9_19640 [Kitasatospora sp. NPDC008050]|uniref:hypothetical protein n=1 Tax=Kitasatospora sp. NPDC008050 TaxID=3364021 RepID=UPI0036E6A8BD
MRSLPTAAPAGPARLWNCLARRGMLHSECEAVDLWQLPPGDRLTHLAQDGVEEALFVLAGDGTALHSAALHGTALHGDQQQRLLPGGLLLLPAAEQVAVTAGPDGLRLLSVRVVPGALSDALPPRIPQLD